MAKRFAYRTAIAGLTALAVITPAVAAPQGPVNFVVAQAQAQETPAVQLLNAEGVPVSDSDPAGFAILNQDNEFTVKVTPATAGTVTIRQSGLVLNNHLNKPVGENGEFSFTFKPVPSRNGDVDRELTWKIEFTPTGGERIDQTVVFKAAKANAKYDPQAADPAPRVLVDSTPEAKDFIEGADLLPATFAWVTAPNTSADQIGAEQELQVKVTYADGSVDTVDVTVTVDEPKQADASAPRLKGEKLRPTVFVGDQPEAKDFIQQPDRLENVKSISWDVAPVTTEDKVGEEQEAQIKIVYNDDSEKLLPVTVTVVKTQESTNEPKLVDPLPEIVEGDSPRAKDFIANKFDEAEDADNTGNLPKGTRFAWEKEPNTAARNVGVERTAQLRVNYPDGSFELVPVTFTLKAAPEAEETVKPKVTNPIKVKINELGEPKSYIDNASELPADATYAWNVKPDVSKLGPTTGRIDVTYADKEGATPKTHTVGITVDVVEQLDQEVDLTKPVKPWNLGFGVAGVVLSAALGLGAQLPFFRAINTRIQQSIGIFNPHLAGAADNAVGLIGGLFGVLGLIPSIVLIIDGYKNITPIDLDPNKDSELSSKLIGYKPQPKPEQAQPDDEKEQPEDPKDTEQPNPAPQPEPEQPNNPEQPAQP